MAMIVDAFVGRCLDVLLELATEEVVRILGVKDDLRGLQEKLEMIKAVLEEAERRRIQEPSVNIWLSKLKDVMYDADDIIDLCRIDGRQLLEQGEASTLPSTSKSVRHRRFPFFLSCCNTVTSVPFRHEIGKEIEKLNQRLEEISRDRTMFSLPQTSSSSVTVTQVDPRQTSSLLTPDFVGAKVERAADGLVESLLSSQGGGLRVLSIVGLGGIGKTTLAQKIFNHHKVEAHFAKKLWVCVSQSYSEMGLLKQIIRVAGGGQDIHPEETKTELLPRLISALAGKRFLLVLDDVWRADVWQDLLKTPLGHGVASGSRVLVTTRDVNVARSMGAIQTYEVQKLSADDGWALLCKTVFEDGADDDIHDLHVIGTRIVEKCDGLPLAIKAVGGVLRTKDRRNKSEWEKLDRGHTWSVTGELPKEVRGALYLSYEDLPSQLKQCFLYCSLWPEDAVLYQEDLRRLWVAEGFITAPENSLPEDIADDCFHDLARRSLLHSRSYPEQMWCKIHDLTRSLALFLTRDESHIVDGNDSTNPNALKLPFPQKNSSRLRRLAIYNMEETETVLNGVEGSKGLRTLRMVSCKQIEVQVLFQRFTHLRVLDLTDSRIESIPESIRNLQHLRLLKLYSTKVSQLPESLGCLVNLQFLSLSSCSCLHTLPKSITQLCNLRCLNLKNTPISHLPIGIGKLEHLTDFQGFVVGEDDNSDRESQHGCGLDELQSMSRLRNIHIVKLERVLLIRRGIQPLLDKPHLKELRLQWTHHTDDRSSNSVGDEQILEDLSPSPSLEFLNVNNFNGLNFPLWISMLPNLTTLELWNCASCQYLPPLGQLPQLRILHIFNMPKVVTIGPELLGCDTEDGYGHKRTPTAFPKLENLTIQSMDNWEEWVCDAKEVDERTKKPIMPLPRLQYLKISRCPELRALPDASQHAAALKRCEISGAKSLREIKNIPSLENLEVEVCNCLERISNLPALRKMTVSYCPMLMHVEKLDMLQNLTLYLDEWREDLPEWLLRVVHEARTNSTLQALTLLRCNEALREKCIEGGQYWPLFCHIPEFSVIMMEREGDSEDDGEGSKPCREGDSEDDDEEGGRE